MNTNMKLGSAFGVTLNIQGIQISFLSSFGGMDNYAPDKGFRDIPVANTLTDLEYKM